MPRNLSTPEQLKPPATASSPAVQSNKSPLPPRLNWKDEHADPDPLPLGETDLSTEPALDHETSQEEAQPGVIHIKTSHITATSLLLGFFAGAVATLFFVHPDSIPRNFTNAATLPRPEDSSQLSHLATTIEQQKSLIQKLKENARSRIGLPIQTVDPQNPQRVTYTPQDIAIAAQWIAKCSSDVTWLCNAPLNPTIVSALNQKKAHNCTILVIAGNQALRPNLSAALQAGYNIYQSQFSLADNTSILIIDSKLVVDLSNSDFVWATAEPTVIKDIATYAINILLKNATHLHN